MVLCSFTSGFLLQIIGGLADYWPLGYVGGVLIGVGFIALVFGAVWRNPERFVEAVGRGETTATGYPDDHLKPVEKCVLGEQAYGMDLVPPNNALLAVDGKSGVASGQSASERTGERAS